MIPLKLWPWKLIGKLIGAAVVVGALWYAVHTVMDWKADSQALKAAQTELAKEQQARREERDAYAANIERDRLAREAFATDLNAIRDRFDNLHIPETLTRTVEVPIREGQVTCPDPRISPEFRLHWNAAATP